MGGVEEEIDAGLEGDGRMTEVGAAEESEELADDFETRAIADQGDFHTAVVGAGAGGDADEATAGGGLIGGDDG